MQTQSKEERTGEKKRKKCTGVRASTHLVAALWAEKRDVVEAAAGEAVELRDGLSPILDLAHAPTVFDQVARSIALRAPTRDVVQRRRRQSLRAVADALVNIRGQRPQLLREQQPFVIELVGEDVDRLGMRFFPDGLEARPLPHGLH